MDEFLNITLPVSAPDHFCTIIFRSSLETTALNLLGVHLLAESVSGLISDERIVEPHLLLPLPGLSLVREG